MDNMPPVDRLFQEDRLLDLPEEPVIESSDPMSEAGRKVFRFHFHRMLYHEPGTRSGQDIEALHDMRVATRRMRAAFQVFGEHFDPKATGPYLKGMKRTGRALGAVRDLDVFREKIQAYLAVTLGAEQSGMERFLAVVEAKRESARTRMLDYLDSPKYRKFVERFGQFVETEGQDGVPVVPNGEEPRPYRVCHVAPVAVFERLAAVLAYDEWVMIPDPPLPRLHALRIACKRLRYTLEFFSDVLGPEAKALIKRVVVIQDHLGGLQDAVVASEILRSFLLWGTWGPEAAGARKASSGPESGNDPGVAGCLSASLAELQHLLDTFPEAWRGITGEEFRRTVAIIVAGL